jgi:hypothetical protein
MAKLNLNASEFENLPVQKSEILPVGEYTMQIIKSDIRETKAGTGFYLQLEFEVLGPTEAGRHYWDRLNLKNPNADAEAIAKRQFRDIYSALGFALPPDDSEEMHFKPLRVNIRHKPNKLNGELETQARYKSAGDVAPAAPAQARPAAAAAPAAKPWERKK